MQYKTPTTKNFNKYGRIIEIGTVIKKHSKKNLFDIIIRERHSGWRIAYLVLQDRYISRLEQHPDSLESFEPVKGKSIIFLALRNNPDKIEKFILNKPIVLYKGIWHGVITISKQSEIKITENVRVPIKYHRLAEPLNS